MSNFLTTRGRFCALLFIAFISVSGACKSAPQTCETVMAIHPGEKVDFHGTMVPTQWICYREMKCIVALNAPPPSFENNVQYAKTLEALGLTKAGGRIRWDIYAGRANCHAYACKLSEVPGIDSRMWLDSGAKDPERPGITINQYNNLLFKFFNFLGIEKLADNPHRVGGHELLEGDLVVLLDDNDMGIHSGVLIENGNDKTVSDLMFRSKLGARFVIDAPIGFASKMPEYGTTKIAVFRRK